MNITWVLLTLSCNGINKSQGFGLWQGHTTEVLLGLFLFTTSLGGETFHFLFLSSLPLSDQHTTTSRPGWQMLATWPTQTLWSFLLATSQTWRLRYWVLWLNNIVAEKEPMCLKILKCEMWNKWVSFKVCSMTLCSAGCDLWGGEAVCRWERPYVRWSQV